VTLLASGERGTRLLARLLASDRRAGDCYFLHGPVGAGKSAFSRAFVRAAAGDPFLPVPSPTFLLLNTYEGFGDGGGNDGGGDGGGDGASAARPASAAAPSSSSSDAPIHHFDLYRLDPAKTSPAELVRLDIPGALASGVALVEWPERLVAIAAAAVQQGAMPPPQEEERGDQQHQQQQHNLSNALAPASRVDVYVEPLSDDGPARAALAEALSSGRAAPMLLPGGALPGNSSAASGDEEEEDDDDDDDDDDSPYADRRWRKWTLVPTSDEWDARLRERVRRAAAAGAAVAVAEADDETGARAKPSGGGGRAGLFLIGGG
jgi:tRNA A37 threonylcarbamoyladenosine biosynthesis protein TsaE